MTVGLSPDTIHKLTVITNRSIRLKPKKGEKYSLKKPEDATSNSPVLLY